MRQATVLRSHGEEFGDNSALADAIDLYRAIQRERMRERVPLEWAATQNDLGIALRTLGVRTGRKDQLEASLAAVRGAAEVYLDEAGHPHREAEFKDRIAEIEASIARLS
jgi:nucleoid-associated protein YgaU